MNLSITLSKLRAERSLPILRYALVQTSRAGNPDKNQGFLHQYILNLQVFLSHLYLLKRNILTFYINYRTVFTISFHAIARDLYL